MKCPICDKSSFVEWCKVESYSIIKCKKCGVGVTAPFPTKEQLIEFNKKTYDVEQRIKIYLSRQDYFEKRYKGYIKNIKTTILQFNKFVKSIHIIYRIYLIIFKKFNSNKMKMIIKI